MLLHSVCPSCSCQYTCKRHEVLPLQQYSLRNQAYDNMTRESENEEHKSLSCAGVSIVNKRDYALCRVKSGQTHTCDYNIRPTSYIYNTTTDQREHETNSCDLDKSGIIQDFAQKVLLNPKQQFIQQLMLCYLSQILFSHTESWKSCQAPHNAHSCGIVADNHSEINAARCCQTYGVEEPCSTRRAFRHGIHSKCVLLQSVSCEIVGTAHMCVFVRPTCPK